MAEQAFKNVRVLKGIPVDQFMATMGFFSASLGETCTDCHSAESGGSWAKYADDNPRKETARRMIGMMNAINKTYFAGKREITCYSCHRGVERPDVTPNLADLYGPPPSKEPDELREPAGKASLRRSNSRQVHPGHLAAPSVWPKSPASPLREPTRAIRTRNTL